MGDPLDQYPTIHSSNTTEIREKLRSILGVNRFDVQDHSGRFVAHVNHLGLASLSLTYCSYSTPVTLGSSEAETFQQVFSIDGSGHFVAGSLSEEIKQEATTSVVPPLVPTSFEYGADSSHLVLRIDSTSLLDHLRLLLHDPCSQPLIFANGINRERPAVESLRRRIFNFAFEMNARGRFLSELAMAEVERMIIMAFLLCNRSNYTPLLSRQPPAAKRSVVQQVEEYIATNWDKPLDAATLAAIANISARSLFRHFERARGYSPLEFVKRIRLQRAFEALAYPAEGTSVMQVALRCGFQNIGHFARDYRLAFGERPSETLARARGNSG